MPTSCVAFNCTARSVKDSGLSFHLFPLKDKELLAKWVEAVRRKNWTPTRSSHLCSKHFTKDSFRRVNGYTYLKPGTVPTIFDFPDQPLQKGPHIKSDDTRTSVERSSNDDIIKISMCFLPLGYQVPEGTEYVMQLTNPKLEQASAAGVANDHSVYHQLHSPTKTRKKIQEQDARYKKLQQRLKVSEQRCRRLRDKVLQLNSVIYGLKLRLLDPGQYGISLT